MKNYLHIVLTLILIALIGIGFILFKTYQVNRDAFKDNIVKMVDETSDKVFVTDTSDLVMVENNGDKEPVGTVSGEICYPSQSIPPLVLYFENVETEDVIKQETELNQDSYEMDLEPATYIAYAYVKGIEESSGGYTEYVPCGLTEDCEDHTLIEFKVVDEGLTSDIDICDWYGAEVPDEPIIE